MAEGDFGRLEWRHSLRLHEAALLCLGVVTALALLGIATHHAGVLAEVAVATALYALALRIGFGRQSKLEARIRFAASFVFVLWFYWSVARIVPAFGMKLRDATLLGIDQGLFGQTPAVACEKFAAGWLTDLFSLCYLSYHVYLGIAVLRAIRILDTSSSHLGDYLFVSFAIGFVGYLLVPAVGPQLAYPGLFQHPLPGSVISTFIGMLIAKGTCGFDVFPSLHVMITCVLLDHDWRNLRRRFWVMIIPAAGMLIATVYLRFHYAIDLLAGMGLFLALRSLFLCRWKSQCGGDAKQMESIADGGKGFV